MALDSPLPPPRQSVAVSGAQEAASQGLCPVFVKGKLGFEDSNICARFDKRGSLYGHLNLFIQQCPKLENLIHAPLVV